MRRVCQICISTLCVIVLLHSLGTTTTARDNWISLQTNNFFLVGNTSEAELRQVGMRLEQFRFVFSRLYPGLKVASSVPITVMVFRNESSFRPYKPFTDGRRSDIAGYFQAGSDVHYIALTTEKGAQNPYRTIFHEYVHLLVKNTLGHANVPSWFNEGLAEYYSTFDMEGGHKVFLGKPIIEHVELLRSGQLLPLKNLFAVSHESLSRHGQEAQGLFYAQSWALIHYLIQGDGGKYAARLDQFLDLLLKNTEVETAFRTVFQTDYATMERGLRAYINRRSFPVSVATFPNKLELDSQMKLAQLTEAEAEAYLGDLLAHIERLDEAAEKLGRALQLNPTLAMAHASLGMVRMKEKKIQEAKPHLQRALESNSSNYLAYYYYAYIISREYMGDGDVVSHYPDDAAALMRENLRKSIELKPDFAESHKLLAFVNLVRNENFDEAVTLMRKAIELSPGSEHYVVILSQIYLRQGNLPTARSLLATLAANSEDEEIRTTAQSLLDSVQVLEDHKNSRLVRGASFSESDSRDDVKADPGKPEMEIVQDPALRDGNSYLEEALRKPAEGQRRIQGLLTRIDCGVRGIFFTLKVDEEVLRLRAERFEDVNVTTYAPDVGGEITCGVRKNGNPVVIIFVPQKDLENKSDGIAISIDFVPRDFRLSK